MKQKYKVFTNNHSKIITENWNSFCSNFNVINAGGGVVSNSQNELLMIFRNNKWDLPKGKQENRETIESCALREVQEECGITNLILNEKIIDTYHVYEINNVKYLKKTTWFKMFSDSTEILIPQISEGITEVKWINKDNIDLYLQNSFATIYDVVKS
jgi:8-oxo-dGTP pyrophosphatase MutT (NUDIX family)